MAEVTLTIGGRQYSVHCGDGEEAHLYRLADLIESKTAIARKASPGLTEVRQLLFAGILLADELSELRAKTGAQGSLDFVPAAGDASGEEEKALIDRITALAERIEAIADTLAGTGNTP
ncbi:MAG: cell division protein ZapA [Sphingobium sp.]